MGIFSWIRTESDYNRAERLKTELKMKNTVQSQYLERRISHYSEEEGAQVIRPFSLFLDVVEMVMKNPDFEGDAARDALVYGGELYSHVFYMGERTPGYEQLCDFFVELFDVGGVVSRRFFIPGLYNLFFEPMNYLRLARELSAGRRLDKEKQYILDFALKIRGYCTNEEMFTAAMAAYITRILSWEDPATVAEESYENFRHLAGIYTVSEERIATAEQKIDTVEIATERLAEALALSEERMKAASELSESTLRTIKNFSDREVTRATTRVRSLREEMERSHEDFMQTQRMSVLADKDALVNSVISESEERLAGLRRDAGEIVAGTREEILRANREAATVIAKTETYFQDNSQIREVLDNAEESRLLNEKISRLMILNESSIGRAIGVTAGQKPAEGGRNGAPGAAGPDDAGEPCEPAADIPDEPEIPGTADADEDREILPVSPLLDPSIAFTTRYERAMKAKEEMEKQGVLFHRMFDDVLTAVMENSNPYLIGPSGCGKTYMVRQIAEILGIPHIDIGYINEEYDILGFQTANGGYSRPNFYRCYKYGKIAFCDELDNGNSRATVKLNSFLSNTENVSYSFPNGENVPRHPNFRIVAAGNTTGNGADANYNSREKIEESVQQRFLPIYVGYDNRMEEAIMADHPEWFQFLAAFRASTDAWAKYTHAGASGIITTRDATKICQYLDNGSFTPKKIVEYSFIQTKDEEYLEFLDKHLRDRMGGMKKPCAEIYKLFHERAVEIISGKDTIRTV